MRKQHLAALFLIFSASSSVYAQTYNYGSSSSGGRHSSAGAACQATANIVYGDNLNPRMVGVTYKGGNQYDCSIASNEPRDPSFTYTRSISVDRQGETCEAPSVLNESKGSCETPENKCSSSKGSTTENHSWHQDSADLPAPKISIDGCAATTGEISSCLAVPTGGFTCVGDITITGDLFVPPPATTEPTTPINPTTPSPTPDPTGGTSGGGTGSNGGETGSGTNPGTGTGSGTGTGTGTNPGTGSGGGTGSGTGSGSGSGSGTGSGSGSSSGNGSGSTGGSGSTPGTGSGSGTSPGTGTGSEGTCEKDCDENGPTTTSLKAPQQGSFDGEGEKWDDKITQAKGDIKKGLDDLKGVFSPIGDISLSGGGTLYCPPSVTVLDKSISFCLNKYADSLSWIGSAVMALCSVIALLIVFG
ncbi:hypothetical protein [Pseudomonas coronafaciens]|uniref:hypothetical protein n=1 Tax=Pseudomonas coronafaciens TaxID=53409 RepID=UPI001681BF93|nr:hypothetical protein [Pseudomonas coronafaciens]